MGNNYRSFDDLPLTLRVENLMPILERVHIRVSTINAK